MLRRISELARPIVSRLTVPLRYAPRMWRWELLSSLASDLGVTVMGVQTAEGLILSRVQDLTVLPWLAKSRTYGLGAQNFVSHVRQLLANGGTYLDIGANLGVTTMPLATDRRITIHSFEPDPFNFKMLASNLSINCPSHHVILHEIALGDEDGILSFELNPNNPADNRLAGSGPAAMGESRWRRIDVQVRRLDDVLVKFSKPLAVKIDTQGAEARVVAGGRRTLAEADLIALEWDPYLLGRVGGDPEVVISLVATFERAAIASIDDNRSEWGSGPAVATRMRAALSEKAAPTSSYYDVLAMRE